jgi:hypothetical protein
MFNDDVQMGFFDVYDQFLLNILYDPRRVITVTSVGPSACLLNVNLNSWRPT